MGLKTTNYEVKKLSITLPEAYAIIKNLEIRDKTGYAEIVVQSTRDNSMKLAPIETVRVDFKVNRNENPYVTAYKTAKGQKEVRQMNRETREVETVTVNMPFYGWEDDIVEEV